MPIHNNDGETFLKVETRLGDDWVNMEDTDFRKRESQRNQQTELRRRYVMEALPGTEPKADAPTSTEPECAPVEMSDEMEKAIKDDLRKRGVSNKPQTIKIPKPKTMKSQN
jgi:hypothetical protein